MWGLWIVIFVVSVAIGAVGVGGQKRRGSNSPRERD